MRRVLCVDDEPAIGRLVAGMLPHARVEVFTRPSNALERIETEAFDAVLCDMRMPEMTGVAFFERVARIRPELAERFTLMTGLSRDEAEEGGLEARNLRMLRKPFTRAELLECLAR
jgi:CheY-like chemotaxis protein